MKIILLEDRPERQKQFLPNRAADYEKLKGIDGLFMPEVTECKLILEAINSENYIFQPSVKLIMVHRSALKSQGIAHLIKQSKQNNIKLIFFSGGIRQSDYSNDGFEQLNLNSADFYSNLLLSFINNFLANVELTILEVYNKEWKLSYLMLYKQLVNNLNATQSHDENDPYDYKTILADRIDRIQKIIEANDFDTINKKIKKSILKL